MATASFSTMYVRHPQKAAAQLARTRKRIVELEAGLPAHAHESLAEHERVVARLEQAFRETGRCEDCGKELTDRTSVQRGIGPDCWSKRVAAGRTDRALPLELVDGLIGTVHVDDEAPF